MLTRSALLHLSRSDGFKKFLTRFRSFNNVTRRFVAGEGIEDAVEAIRDLNRKGISASFDHLGESITQKAEALAEVSEYLSLFDNITRHGLRSGVSVKLTQLGLDIDSDFCYRNTRAIVQAARDCACFVRIDMEDSSKTDPTLDVFRRLRLEFDNVGIVIQSYLRRSEADVEALLDAGAAIRLCKGAYDEPPSVAFPDKADVDANFVRIMKALLSSGVYHAIATHDEKMIDETKRHARDIGLAAERFEFQMLFGVRRDLQEILVSEGYRMRVYVPYGRYWYPYFMRRLAERPANIWFVLRNMIKG
ncbi:MAG TPA: proline dehydrogenase family protein [Blastocatellia bacterium]|nr:proline dehydrogenase family protein [Blastocatellia bacterium]